MLKSGLFTGACALFLLSVFSGARAQNITETHWYFGNSNQNLIFDKNGREPNLFDYKSTPFGAGGAAVVSDQHTGNLMFYSDGQRVYDATHTLLPALAGGGALLSGNPAINQPVVACPFPDNGDNYYLFTNPGANAPNEILFSVIDASLQGNGTMAEFPKGDLTLLDQPTGLTDPSEGMLLLESPDGNTFWLITQNRTTFDFRVTAITAAGVDSTQTFNFATGVVPGFEAAAMSFNEDSLLIAVAPRTPNRNIQLLNFDPATGELSFSQSVLNTGFADAGPDVIYDVEWSDAGSKLYFSRTGDGTNPGALYQLDLNDNLSTVNEVLPYTFFRSWGLKRGIDGRIYHLYQLNDGSPFNLGRLDFADSALNLVAYDSLVFDTDFQGRQFPAHAPGYLPAFTTMDFTYFDSCQNDITKFVPLVDPLPHSYTWDFGDGNTSSAVAPNHEYQAPGGYLVTLTVELNGRVGSITRPVEIFQGDSSLNLGNDTTICVDEVLTLRATTEGATGYVWSTGETDSTIQVDTAGTYWVEVTVGACTAFDEIEVTEYGVQRQISNQWYFGDMAGLDFNQTPPQPLLDGMMETPEGCATISDIDGHLLFYTNGRTVWNRDHEVMEGGTNIGGDSTAVQSALIVPFTDDNTMFYIFTTEEVYGSDFEYRFKYSLVDIKKDTADGAVIAKNIPLMINSTEKVTASGFTGSPWVLTHEFGNNNFRSYQVTADGIQAPVYSVAGEILPFEEELSATGYLKFSPAGGLIANALRNGTGNFVQLLDYDFTTGIASNERLIDINEALPAQVYGVEFSASGNRLYVSAIGGGSTLIQYDLDSLNAPTAAANIEATKFDGYAVTTTLGALQTGPDGIIYGALEGSTNLASIGSPDADNIAANYTEGVGLGGRTSHLGLPNFVQQQGASGQQPGITVDVACAGQPTSFSGQGRDSSIETYRWNFGDGDSTTFLTSPDTTHVYAAPGTYTVTLTLRNRCDVDSVLTDTVEVFSIPEQPMVPTDTALCDGPITLSLWDVDDPNLRYYWSTGDTTQSVTFDEPAIVDVAIINTDGCSSDTLQVFIGDNQPDLELGPDMTICQNDTVPDLDARNPTADITWTVNGNIVGSERFQPVNTTTSGTFIYAVSIIDAVTGCIARDSVEITILDAPDITTSLLNQPSCGNPDGAFELTINSTGAFSYQVLGPTSMGPFTFDGPGTPPALTGLQAGSYSVMVTNAVSGCTQVEVFQMEDNAPFDMEATALNDCAESSDIQVNFRNVVPGLVDINVLDRAGNIVYSDAGVATSSPVVVNDLDTGTYYVEVRDPNPPFCVQTDTVTLTVSAECFLTLDAPNAFTPNGDGLNDEFYIISNDFVADFEIYIYNRWGQLVFYSTDPNFRWNGKFQDADPLPNTYAYKMFFTSMLEPDRGRIEQYGSVTIIK